eukprot:TRINITY_DN47445_c0_g1_i1.p1 TRINITY_DN47445_c0_g1~~TRINITY_DN47445_c0_g1_i1.p1  ORF type:complete len:150 (+),score=51.70 TRINITY_DN47445_c0_g1_i1:88-537(+)
MASRVVKTNEAVRQLESRQELRCTAIEDSIEQLMSCLTELESGVEELEATGQSNLEAALALRECVVGKGAQDDDAILFPDLHFPEASPVNTATPFSEGLLTPTDVSPCSSRLPLPGPGGTDYSPDDTLNLTPDLPDFDSDTDMAGSSTS